MLDGAPENKAASTQPPTQVAYAQPARITIRTPRSGAPEEGEPDWSKYKPNAPVMTCTCLCHGHHWKSLVGLHVGLQRIVAKDPCPKCGRKDNLDMVFFPRRPKAAEDADG